MSLGEEFKSMIAEMVAQDFGSLLSFQRNERTENIATGEVSTVTTSESFLGAITETKTLSQYFTESTVLRCSTAVVVPVDQLSVVPTQNDKIQLGAGDYLTVVEVSTYLGPNPQGAPVNMGYLLALGS